MVEGPKLFPKAGTLSKTYLRHSHSVLFAYFLCEGFPTFLKQYFCFILIT